MADLDSLALDLAPIALVVLQERRILRTNQAFCELFGWDKAQIEGRSMRALYPTGRDFEMTGAALRPKLASGRVHEDDRFLRHQDGSLLWVHAQGRSLTPDAPFQRTVWSFAPLPERPHLPQGLTPRERAVAAQIANGRTSKETAALLGISPRTVEVHRAAILRKLGVTRTAEMVARLIGGATLP